MLKLENAHKTFSAAGSLRRELSRWRARFTHTPEKQDSSDVKAVRGISLDIRHGEVLGLVGESGSGKSTLGRLLAGLYKPDAGRALFEGHDLATLNKAEWKAFRRQVQIMFQDPVSSLNPRLTGESILEEGLIIHRLGSRVERRARILKLLDEVGLPVETMKRYPHQFSGGQRQRLSLARALSLNPNILIADEPVSALDVSIQAQVVNLLLDLKESRGLTLIMISHDLPLIRVLADRLAVMYGGLLMELLPKNFLGQIKHHPYLLSLKASAEGLGVLTESERYILEGEPPDPRRPLPGCPFQPRCPEAYERCLLERPPLLAYRNGWFCACHRRDASALSGV